jgi:hypothetical protein
MLLLVAALSLDFGYGYVERRTMTNAAQSAALGVGRLLATSLLWSSGSPSFPNAQEDVWTEACTYARQNLGSPPTSETYTLTLEFLVPGTSTPPLGHTRTSTFTSSSCPTITGSTGISSTIRDVRVTVLASYSAILAGVGGRSTLNASGSARARVVGASVFYGGQPWPVVGHYDYSLLTASTCSSPCNPSTASAYQFWSNSDSYGPGAWKGAVDYSRCSTALAASSPSPCAPQLITSWDQSGSAYATPATPTKSPVSGCNPGGFDTAGAIPASVSNDKSCAVPNWVYYGFRGTLSLCTNWRSTAESVPTPCPTGAARATPTAVPSHSPNPLSTTRTVCTSLPSFLIAPSCSATGNTGDWVETVDGSPVTSLLKTAIHTFGSTTDWSTDLVPGSATTTYGKALVVNAYLWDCAEEYRTGGGAGWYLISPGSGDCSTITIANWPGGKKADRVHLFAVAPFTFYEGLVDTSGGTIKGFWGGGFSSVDSCPSGDPSQCALTASNTTMLVGD